MKNRTLRQITAAGVIAAAYAALSLVLATITFGPVQCRVSEALTLLPVLSPAAIWGVTLGCAITNGVGAATGANFLGLIDLLVGTGGHAAGCYYQPPAGEDPLRRGTMAFGAAAHSVQCRCHRRGMVLCCHRVDQCGILGICRADRPGTTPSCLLGVWLIHLLERRGLQNIIEGK